MGSLFKYNEKKCINRIVNSLFKFCSDSELNRRQAVTMLQRLNKRHQYLTKIQKYLEQGSYIIYLDETCFDTPT